jgi:hypothetical protein
MRIPGFLSEVDEKFASRKNTADTSSLSAVGATKVQSLEKLIEAGRFKAFPTLSEEQT